MNNSESREPQLNRRRLFDGNSEENGRASLGMDEDSNMSVNSTASDSQDGVTSAPAAPTPTEGDNEGIIFSIIVWSLTAVFIHEIHWFCR